MGFRRAPELLSVDMPHPASHTSLIPQGTAARASWLPSPFPQQRSQDICSSLAALWGNKMPLPIPKDTTGLQGKILGRNFQFVIVTAVAGPTELVVGEGERSAPSCPLPSHGCNGWRKHVFCHLQTIFHLGRAAAWKTPVGSFIQLILKPESEATERSSAEKEISLAQSRQH